MTQHKCHLHEAPRLHLLLAHSKTGYTPLLWAASSGLLPPIDALTNLHWHVCFLSVSLLGSELCAGRGHV